MISAILMTSIFVEELNQVHTKSGSQMLDQGIISAEGVLYIMNVYLGFFTHPWTDSNIERVLRGV